MLSNKHHLIVLSLIFTSRLGQNGELKDDISEEEHGKIEDVLSNLCPPTSTERLNITGYYARGLPQWMRTMSAFGSLRRLQLDDYACCTQLPNGLGLAQHACRLRELDLGNIEHLVSLENFPSLVKLWSYDNLRLERISNNPSLQWIDISKCPALKELDGLPSLRSLEWEDLNAKALPEYLREAKLKKLRLDCSRSLLKLIALQDESSEWGKIQHIQQLKVYGHKTEEEEDADQSNGDEDADEKKANQSEEDEADEEAAEQSEEDDDAKWHIYYTKEPYSFHVYLGE
ncbi:unnamed protein product [Urochloa humidicola]